MVTVCKGFCSSELLIAIFPGKWGERETEIRQCLSSWILLGCILHICYVI